MNEKMNPTQVCSICHGKGFTYGTAVTLQIKCGACNGVGLVGVYVLTATPIEKYLEQSDKSNKGKSMPVDYDAKVKLFLDFTTPRPLTYNHQTMISHFATCPDANKFRMPISLEPRNQ